MNIQKKYLFPGHMQFIVLQLMKIYIATENKGKLSEVLSHLSDNKELSQQVQFHTLKDLNETQLGLYNPVEDGDTYIKNAAIKAKALYEIIKQPVIADDSGIEVDVLNSRPGIASARYAESDEKRIEKLLNELEPYPESARTAHFISVICYMDQSGNQIFFNGRVDGKIVNAKGVNGFGYDPVFYYEPLKKTYSQMSPEEKRSVSHRGRALALLFQYLQRNR